MRPFPAVPDPVAEGDPPWDPIMWGRDWQLRPCPNCGTGYYTLTKDAVERGNKKRLRVRHTCGCENGN